MSKNKRFQYLIDQYKLGKLSRTELQEIADLRLTDTLFQELYDAEVLLHESSRLNDLVDKMNVLKGVDEDVKKEEGESDLISRAVKLNVLGERKKELEALEEELKKPKKNAFNRRRWLSIAASLLILVTTVWWVSQPTAAERYFDEHFVPDDQPFTVRGPADDLKQKCYTHYDKWEWPEAIECILDLKKVDPDPRHDYYLGICYLGNKEWEKAEEMLKVSNDRAVKKEMYLELIKKIKK